MTLEMMVTQQMSNFCLASFSKIVVLEWIKTHPAYFMFLKATQFVHIKNNTGGYTGKIDRKQNNIPQKVIPWSGLNNAVLE